jgi:CDP-glycerol glycerophosphotransferase (TagB/SpsB family)
MSGLIRRKPDVWIFGSEGDKFSDNSKYLFIHVTENHPEIVAVWITGNQVVIDKINQTGGMAYQRWSLPGIYYTLVGKYWFVSYYVSDINHWLADGAILTNLWHGTPIKKIEFDITEGHLAELYQQPTFLQKHVFKSHIFRKPDFVIGSSEPTNGIYASAFRIDHSRCLPLGLPRLDILGESKAGCVEFVRKWGRATTLKIMEFITQFDKVYLYAPTFRDSNPNFLQDLDIDAAALNATLQASNVVLLLKLHPATPDAALKHFAAHRNIQILDAAEDIYPILPFCDYLITDYSSVFIDFLLLDREMFFFSFDIDEYLSKSRALYYEYRDIVPGRQLIAKEDFMSLFEVATPALGFNANQRRLVEFFYDHRDFNSSARIVDYFKLGIIAGSR